MNVKTFLVALALMTPSLTFAHEADKGPNGGRLIEASGYHVELVLKTGVVEVFITDKNEKPVAASGYKGTAILLIAGKQQRVVLEPSGSDRLTGTIIGAVPTSPKGVVQLFAPTGNISAHFK